MVLPLEVEKEDEEAKEGDDLKENSEKKEEDFEDNKQE